MSLKGSMINLVGKFKRNACLNYSLIKTVFIVIIVLIALASLMGLVVIVLGFYIVLHNRLR